MPSGNQVMLRRHVAARLETITDARSGDTIDIVSPELLHRAGVPARGSDPVDPGASFSWRPDRARRSLGSLAAARYLRGNAESVTNAVEEAAELAVSTWRRTGRRRHYWEPWLAVLDLPTRAEVLAQATTWAAGLVTSIDWSALHFGFEIGPHDALWALPPDHRVRLKSRSDVRIVLPPSPGCRCLPEHATTSADRHEALVVVIGGYPTPVAETALAYVALVEGLRHPTRPLPARVGGVWPDAGEVRVVDIDASRLATAIDLSVAFLCGQSAPRAGQPVGAA